MAQKTRNSLESTVNSKIYDNANKEIIARYVREVLRDYRDSNFNLKDDKLKNVIYEDNMTLEQKLANTANVPPLWGATQYFDVGSQNGNMNGNNEGIITSTSFNHLTSHDSVITIGFDQSISKKKLIVNLVTNDNDLNAQNDICAPIIKYQYSSTQIKVALREVSGGQQSIRIEIMAFSIKN